MNIIPNLTRFTLLRSTFLVLSFLFFDYFIGFNENNISVALSIIAGAALATFAVKRKINIAGVVLLSSLIYFLPKLIFFIGQFPVHNESTLFKFYSIYEHSQLLFILLTTALLTSYLALRVSSFFQIEFLTLQLLIIALTAGHRNYHFDMVKKVNDLAWQLNISPFLVIVSGSALLILFSVAYMYTANSAEFIYGSVERIKSSKKLNFSGLTLVTFFSLIVILLARIIYNYHFSLIDTKITNGVGSASKEGLSPLDFHSALGSSNQPTALVRLNGDYNENPLSPMLYLRESALSTLTGNQLALAGNKYDLDTSRSRVNEHFNREQINDYGDRKELDISVYTLNDHKLSFAIDYPIKIAPLKLSREQQKFKSAYHALSMVPIFSLEDFADASTGDSSWSAEELKHYTEPHPDKRYQAKALEIIGDVKDNLSKVLAITKYLSEVSTYTLKPDHQIDKDEDPTAPYLFGDLRGYCVHFAHATVFMLRSLGIPARIGTGYLTDLSQARDGHILLRMSDRHAWPEVYLDSFGWIPFDVTPEKVESSAESPVDQSVLEELIDSLGTDEELLSDDLIKDEFQDEVSSVSKLLPYLKYLLLIIPLIIALLYIAKFYQYFFWRFCQTDRLQYKYSYIALISLLHDIGFKRAEGETKEAYLQRVEAFFKVSIQDYAKNMNRLIFSKNSADAPHSVSRRIYRALTTKQKIAAWILPRAAFNGIGIWKW
jgi:transglutaminase-like putative cysteine protease